MKPGLRAALPWAIILLVAVAATLLRYDFIEPADAAHACDGARGPWWCGTRNLVVQGFLNYSYGYAAIVVALVAIFWRSAWVATLAACLGVLALQLYCYEGGALGLLIGALRLVRVQYDQNGESRAARAPTTAAS